MAGFTETRNSNREFTHRRHCLKYPLTKTLFLGTPNPNTSPPTLVRMCRRGSGENLWTRCRAGRRYPPSSRCLALKFAMSRRRLRAGSDGVIARNKSCWISNRSWHLHSLVFVDTAPCSFVHNIQRAGSYRDVAKLPANLCNNGSTSQESHRSSSSFLLFFPLLSCWWFNKKRERHCLRPRRSGDLAYTHLPIN
jgi:hypothetical protein